MLLLANLAATLFMTGLVWFVQIVHYPLYARVGNSEFVSYEKAHMKLTTYVVFPPMLIELATSIALLVYSPARISASLLWIAAALTGIVWVSTLALQIPQHAALSGGYDAAAQQQLVSGNWVRTAAWTLRSGILCWMVSRAIESAG